MRLNEYITPTKFEMQSILQNVNLSSHASHVISGIDAETSVVSTAGLRLHESIQKIKKSPCKTLQKWSPSLRAGLSSLGVVCLIGFEMFRVFEDLQKAIFCVVLTQQMNTNEHNKLLTTHLQTALAVFFSRMLQQGVGFTTAKLKPTNNRNTPFLLNCPTSLPPLPAELFALASLVLPTVAAAGRTRNWILNNRSAKNPSVDLQTEE